MNHLSVGNIIVNEKGRPYICLESWHRSEGSKLVPRVAPLDNDGVYVHIPLEDRFREVYDEDERVHERIVESKGIDSYRYVAANVKEYITKNFLSGLGL